MARRARPLFVLAAAALTLACAHRRYEPKGAPIPYQGSFSTLPSGLRVVVYEMPQVDRFSVTISYGSGSAEDPAARPGLAHLVEHLSYRARPPWASNSTVWDRLATGGFRFDGRTDPDTTDYTVAGKPNDLRLALALEAARMRAPLEGVSEDDLAVERDVVISEYRERFETDPFGAQLAWVVAEAYGDHPYGRTGAGTPEAVRRITLADARAWAAEHYRPENAILVVVSPKKPRDVMDLAVDALGELAGLEGPRVQPLDRRPPPLPPPRDEEIAPATFKAAVAQPAVWVAWRVPGYLAQRDPAAEYTARSLRARFALEAAVAAARGLEEVVDDFETAYVPYAGGGLLLLRATLFRAGDAPRVIELAKTAAFRARMADRAAGVGSVRDQLLIAGYLAVEEVDGAEVARFLRATGNPDLLAARQKQIWTQLHRAPFEYAVEHLRREQTVAVVVLPDPDAAARALAPTEARPPRHDEPELPDDAPGVDAAGVAAAARAPGLAAAERRVLENGLTVVIAQRGALPLVEVRLVVRTGAEGTAAIPAGLPLVALTSGSAEFADRSLDLVGAGGGVWVGAETITFAARGSSANLDVLLESTAEWARDQRARWFDVAHQMAHRRARLHEGDLDSVVRRALSGALFPDHPYGATPTTAGIGALRERDADRWLSQEIRPEHATLVVLSDQPPTDALWSAVERHLGGWSRGNGARAALPPPPLPAARRVLLVDRAGASQAVVIAALRAPPRVERDEAAAEAVRWLVESRLNQRVRIEDGVSYGVHVAWVDHEKASALVVRAAVERDAAAPALREILGGAERLASTPVYPADAARARWRGAREHAFRFDTLRDAADALVTAAAYDLPGDHWERQPASIAALDAERIRKAAASLAIGREVVVVVGDAGVLRPRLEAAGLVVEPVR
jgi:zinc protease